MPWFMNASTCLKGLIAALVLVAGFGLGYWLREGGIAGLEARLDERGQRLAQIQQDHAQEEEEALQARLELADARTEQGRVEEERTVLERTLATIETDLRAEVAQITDDRGELQAALLLEAQVLSTSLEVAEKKTSVAFLLQQQGFSAKATSQYDAAADFFARAAQSYGESLPALESIVQQRDELSSVVPQEARLVYAQAATRAEVDVEFAAALTAEFTGGAKLYRVVHELLTFGDDITERDNERWATLLADANQDLQDGLERLDDVQALAPELWRLVEGRRLGFENWQDLYEDMQLVLEAPLG